MVDVPWELHCWQSLKEWVATKHSQEDANMSSMVQD
jgi:hypothetical protein